MSKRTIFKPNDREFHYAEVKFCYSDNWEGGACRMYVVDVSYTYIKNEETGVWEAPHWDKVRLQATANGNGYDRAGTCLGEWMGKAFDFEYQLERIGHFSETMYYAGDDDTWKRVSNPFIFTTEPEGQLLLMPNPSAIHGVYTKYDKHQKKAVEYLSYDGACGFNAMLEILYHLGYELKFKHVTKGSTETHYYELQPVTDDTYFRQRRHKAYVLPKSGQLVFKLQERKNIPTDIDGGTAEGRKALIDWVNDEKNVRNRTLTLDVKFIDSLRTFVESCLGYDCKHKHYTSGENAAATWESDSSVGSGRVEFPIKTLSLLIEESNIEVTYLGEKEGVTSG